MLPIYGTSVRRKEREKGHVQVGFEPRISKLQGVRSTTVLQPLPSPLVLVCNTFPR